MDNPITFDIIGSDGKPLRRGPTVEVPLSMLIGETLRVGFTGEVPKPPSATLLTDGEPHERELSKPFVAATDLYVTAVDYEKRIVTLDSKPTEVEHGL